MYAFEPPADANGRNCWPFGFTGPDDLKIGVSLKRVRRKLLGKAGVVDSLFVKLLDDLDKIEDSGSKLINIFDI